MARRPPDTEVDQLYQVPLGEFTSERNALAKRTGDSAIRALQKPTLSAWAVNQLFWRERAVYDQLLERANDLRATHSAALKGQKADLRGASRAHEEAVAAALRATLALLATTGQSVTEATRQGILTTLRSLPSEEAPGRLTRQLEPRGFDALSGPAATGRVRVPAPPPKGRTTAPATPTTRDAAATAARVAAAKQALAHATQTTRDVEGLVRRQEFEVARLTRESDKAQRNVAEAEEALRQAEAALQDAQRAATAATKARDAAEARARKAAADLVEARERQERARAALSELT